MQPQFEYQNGGQPSPTTPTSKASVDFESGPSPLNNGSLEFDELLASGGKKRKRFDANDESTTNGVMKYKGGTEVTTTAAAAGHPGAFDYAKGFDVARAARAGDEAPIMTDEYGRGVAAEGGETGMGRAATSNEEMAGGGGVGGGASANNNYASSEDLNQNVSEQGEKAGMSGSDDESTGECGLIVGQLLFNCIDVKLVLK